MSDAFDNILSQLAMVITPYYRIFMALIRSVRVFSDSWMDMDMKDSNALRVVCKEFREAIMDFP